MLLIIDIGGTVTRISGTQGAHSLLPPILFPTEPDIDAGIARIAHHAKKLGIPSPKRVVAGIAGEVSPRGVLLKGPNLSGWEHEDVAGKLSREFNAPTDVLNDAVLGGLGEAHDGAGKHAKTLLYVTFGTGIGISRVLHGKPDISIGTEAGHQYLLLDNTLMEAEDLVSGKALRHRYGKPGEEIHDPAIWKECAHYAAVVVYNSMLHFAPDKVVIGGALTKEGSLSVEDIELNVAKMNKHITALPQIVRGTLGDIAGLYGARAYARELS